MLDVDEAAKRLNVSRATIYRLVGDGRLPAFRLIEAGALRILADELDPSFSAHRVTTKED